MSEHTRHVHEVFYWVEIVLAPLLCWLVWIVTKEMWKRGWLGDDWPDPQADVDTFDRADGDLDGGAWLLRQEPEVDDEEPAPWRR